jgi:diguanylate cyclase (GGDEF)-like protein/PAS domain S-box-containing protein
MRRFRRLTAVPAPRRAPGRLRRWRFVPLLVAAAAVIGAMVAIGEAARRDADRARQAQAVIESVRSASMELNAITWRSLATDANTHKNVPFSVGNSAYTDVVARLRELRALGVARERTRDVERRVGDVYSAGVNAQLIAHANPAAAQRMADSTFVSTVQRLDAALSRTKQRQQELATAALRRSRIAWLSSLVVGLALLALLAWRLHRMQRGAALAEHARAAERRGDERVRALVRHSSDVVAVIDAGAGIRWIAESVTGMLGYGPASLVGRSFLELVHEDEIDGAAGFLEHVGAEPGRIGTLSVRVRGADDRDRQLEVVADNHIADPVIGGVLLNLRDVSERLALERQLRHQAFHDTLTGLANRALFEDRLTHALARARRTGTRLAVIFVDLDDFKTVNDSLGHAAGDELLRMIAGRLEGALRTQDTAARLGGDEFAALLEDVSGEAEALEVAERVRRALEPAATIGTRELIPSASIGVACPAADAGAEEVLRNADLAMYAAKDRGKAQVAGFEDAMHARVSERLELSAQLAKALEQDELALVYQPVVDLDSTTMTGVEALLRWDHPTRGRLAPDRFIPLAESTGAIVPIGRWVLGTACAQLRRWDEMHTGRDALTMSVNVSTRQLADPEFPAHVREALAATGVAPQRLTLEITEHLLVEDSEYIHRQLGDLKRIGVQLAVDDFGTGYSALSYMRSFPIDTLKIDRSFTSGIDQDAEKAGIVRAIVEMGHQLRLKIVTEGIEQPAEAALLRDFRSDYGQGYLFSRPVEAAAIEELLAGAEGAGSSPLLTRRSTG